MATARAFARAPALLVLASWAAQTEPRLRLPQASTAGLPVLKSPRGLPDRTPAPHGAWRRQDLHLQVQQLVSLRALLQVLETGDNSRERSTAATLLGALQDVRALPALQEVLEREQDLMTRRAAANGLRLLQTPETIPVFSTVLADKQDDRFVRMSAAYGLAQLGEAQDVTELMQIFDEAEQDGRGRFVAFRVLTSLNDPAALPLMRQLTVSDADVSYRVAAMRFLAEHGDQEALPLLQQVLNSSREQPSVLEAAAQSHAAIISGQVPAKGVGTTVRRDTGSGTRGESLERPGLTRGR
jgi:HEAT repeat protein